MTTPRRVCPRASLGQRALDVLGDSPRRNDNALHAPERRRRKTSSAPSSSFAAEGYGSLVSPRNNSSPWSSAVSSSFVTRPNTRRKRRLLIERR